MEDEKIACVGNFLDRDPACGPGAVRITSPTVVDGTIGRVSENSRTVFPSLLRTIIDTSADGIRHEHRHRVRTSKLARNGR